MRSVHGEDRAQASCRLRWPGFSEHTQPSLTADHAVDDESATDQQYGNSQPQKDDRHHFLLHSFLPVRGNAGAEFLFLNRRQVQAALGST
jgi:hypothetical protein